MPSPREALRPFTAVIITGGSSGIGKSFIELASKVKPELVFCNLSRRSPADNSSADDRIFLNHFPCDVSRAGEVDAAAAQVSAFLGRAVPTGQILLINNSGFGTFAPFPEANLERELTMVDVNVRAVVHLTGRFLPLLKARGGAILNVASIVAFQPTPFTATYGATKAFVLHWTLALNEELRGSGVRALAVCPGTTRTAFFRTAGLADSVTATALTMTPEQVVATAFHALGSGRAQIVPGWINWLYTSAAARLPKPFAARIAGWVVSRMRSKPTQP